MENLTIIQELTNLDLTNQNQNQIPKYLRHKIFNLITDIRSRWSLMARPAQLPPDDMNFNVWLMLGGRGGGKTRAGAELLKYWVENETYGRMALIGRTPGDVRDIMIEGESGLLSLNWKSGFQPRYKPALKRIEWDSGAKAFIHTSYEPESLRGFQCEGGWLDDMAAWQYIQDTWDMYMFGCRLGVHPRTVITSTIKPIKLLKGLINRSKINSTDVYLTKMTTYENLNNLAPSFREAVLSRYEGTRLGKQELLAELLEDVEGALWKRSDIDRNRIGYQDKPEMAKIAIGIDPAASSTAISDETGIVACGRGVNKQHYTLADVSGIYTPDGWARAAINLYFLLRADVMVAEKNNGGDMVLHTIRTTVDDMRAKSEINSDVNIKLVWASRGKITRAEPIAALSEQGRDHHVGTFGELEDQLCEWTAGESSPDRMDAKVWADTELYESSGEFKIH